MGQEKSSQKGASARQHSQQLWKVGYRFPHFLQTLETHKHTLFNFRDFTGPQKPWTAG